MAYHRLNCSLILIALITVAVLSPALFINKVQAPSGQPWWDTNWQYRKSIQVDNTLNSKTLTDYPASIAFDAGSLISAGKMKSDLSDLRFYDPDSSTVLNYWIESMPTPDQPASPDVMNWKYPSNPLVIPTQFAGYTYTDVVHPKVLYFPSSYGGYKYWMFYEPVGGIEVLVLVRSNDGITWTENGVTNPILPNGPSGSFDSWACADPDVIIVSGTWYLFFDGSNGSADKIGLATSTDGLHWTKFDRNADGVEDPVLYSDVNYVAPDGHKYESADLFLSPTAYHDGTKFWLWLGSGEGTRSSNVVHTMLFSCVDPTGTWTRENNAEPVLSPEGWEGNAIWHIEVSKHGDEFWMYYCAPSQGSIGFARSTDKVTWTKSTRNPILTVVPGTWEGSGLYRSSCIEVGSEIWLYYSAYGTQNGRIGLAKALPSAGNPNAVIQVKIPSILAGSQKTIYMYYGNPSASAMSNGDNTFSFFDDFEDNSLSPTKWQTGGGGVPGATPIGSISETNQHLEINEKTSNGGSWVDLYTVTKTSFDFSNGMSFRVFLENLDTLQRAVVIDLIPDSTTSFFLYNEPQWVRFMVYAGLYYLQIRYPGPVGPGNPVVVKTTSAAGDLNRVVEIQIDDTRLRCLLDGVVWADWYTHNMAWNSANVYLEQSTSETNSFTTVHDNIVIRNFIPPDPTTSLGSEEAHTQIYINPQLTQKTIGDVGTSFKVDVAITDVTDLRGFDIKLTWDNTLLTLTSVDFTTTLNNIWGSGNWYSAVEESGAGYYKLVAVSTANGFTSTGPTPLYELTFTVQDPQSNFLRQTHIHFDTHKLSDSQANPIPHTVSDGTYMISGETPTLQMSPTSKTCRKYGETFTVSITVLDAYYVQDFEFEVHYDTTLLDYASITWDAWGSGTITFDEAGGIITGSTSGSTINGPRTLVTIQFSAAYHRIWKDESKIPGWKNDQSGVIYVQSAKLSYPGSLDLSYLRGGTQNQINVGPDVTYTFSPIQGDIENNGLVDVFDLRTVAAYYDQVNLTYDLNGDSIIDIFDLVLVGANFGYTFNP